MKAIEFAQRAAEKAFDAYLDANNATAAMHVPDEVIAAAKQEYVYSKGRKHIEVHGRGNTTHPVISVTVIEV